MRLTSFVCLAFAAVTAACYQANDYPESGPMTNGPYVEVTTVTIRWHANVDDIAKACNSPGGGVIYSCAYVGVYPTEPTRGACTIHAIKPRDFNDVAKLAAVGHEFFHCLGAQHA